MCSTIYTTTTSTAAAFSTIYNAVSATVSFPSLLGGAEAFSGNCSEFGKTSGVHRSSGTHSHYLDDLFWAYKSDFWGWAPAR